MISFRTTSVAIFSYLNHSVLATANKKPCGATTLAFTTSAAFACLSSSSSSSSPSVFQRKSSYCAPSSSTKDPFAIATEAPRTQRQLQLQQQQNRNQESQSFTNTAISKRKENQASAMFSTSSLVDTGYLDAASAYALDQDLMTEPGFCLEQLMELAGLAVAEAVFTVGEQQQQQQRRQENRPRTLQTKRDHNTATSTSTVSGARALSILLVCGPGNNGGDGLVAARHLTMFGYHCTVVYPKRSKSNRHYENLVQQCRDLDIEVLDEMPVLFPNGTNTGGGDAKEGRYDIIVDAIFGFSFHGTPREPFGAILAQLKDASMRYRITTIAVDVPSGWNVDKGDVVIDGDNKDTNDGYMPDVLVSLTAPKLCAKSFTGRHFIGGRFLPPRLADKYNIRMPPYPGVQQVVEVTSSTTDQRCSDEKSGGNKEVEGQQYFDYLAEKKRAEQLADNEIDNGNPKDDKEKESWEQQYFDYLAEKESKENAACMESSNENPKDEEVEESWEQQYFDYLAEKERSEQLAKVESSKEESIDGDKDKESWKQQYFDYLAEKERSGKGAK